MNLCSMVVHVRSERVPGLQRELTTLPGVEIHAADEAGKLVITVENETDYDFSETVMKVHNIDGVLSAAMVYHYREESEQSLKEASQ